MKRRVKRHAVTQPLDPSYRLIPLTQGQNAIVDTKDFNWLSQWNWCAYWNTGTRSFYAKRRDNISMHAALGYKNGDHRNHDTLDNRRSNLRNCTHSQNTQNRKPWASSGHKGVSWHKHTGRWQARIQAKGKTFYLGLFASKEEAATVYTEAAKKYHGTFAFAFPFITV